MRRVRASIAVMAVTVMAAGAMLTVAGLRAERPTPVRAARVTLGDVEQLTVLSGVVRGQEEYAALVPSAGVVAQVYVKPGDAVTEGQALFRLDDRQEVAALSAAWAAGDSLTALPGAAEAAAQAGLRLANLTVRAQTDGFVEQVSVRRLDGVTAGMPAMLLSGAGQEVRCLAVVRDAAELRAGMQARICFGGAMMCMGRVASIGVAQADTATGQVTCEVRILPDEPLSLPLGAAVEAEVIRAAATGVTVLPVTAVTESGTVWWIGDGRAWEVPVTSSLQDEALCWVSLPVGTAAVDAPRGLTHGQRVKEVQP